MLNYGGIEITRFKEDVTGNSYKGVSPYQSLITNLSYQTISKRRSTFARITDDAKVEITNSKHDLTDGGAYYKDGKKKHDASLITTKN